MSLFARVAALSSRSFWARPRLLRAAAILLVPAALGLVSVSFAATGSAATLTSIENANPGTPIPPTDGATAGQIEGYASQQSVNVGSSIGLRLSSKIGPVDIHVFRLGYYGGANARQMLVVNNVAASQQAVPSPDAFGQVVANWGVTYTLPIASTWMSGIYVAGLYQAGASAPSGFVTFVVRNDAATSAFIYVVSMNTYEAYNGWGGKSLYGYNSTGSVPAHKVSFDRPFDSGDGAGMVFEGDQFTVQFLEKEGYDVTYASSSDLEANGSLIASHRAFLSSFHDEYWSTGMRNTIENAVAAGKHAAFFGANSMYWQVRYENATDGRPYRTMVAYKYEAALDPVQGPTTTGRWEDPPTNRPEYPFLGAAYEGDFNYGDSVPWVVTNAAHWIYNGTGLANGDQIQKMVGYEWDRTYDNGLTPPGLITLSQSTPRAGGLQQGTIYQKGNALVFNASTIYWPWMLSRASWGIDTRVQQMTRNLLNAMINPAGPPPTTAPATTTTMPNTDLVVRNWDFEDGTTQGWGEWYGTGVVSNVAVGSHGGQKALRSTVGPYAAISNMVFGLVPGTTYKFMAYLRNDAPTFDPAGTLTFLNVAGTSVAPDVTMVSGVDSTGRWKTLTATFVVPALTNGVYVGINGGGTTMTLDDASITTPAPGNATTTTTVATTTTTIAPTTTTIAPTTTTTVAPTTTTLPPTTTIVPSTTTTSTTPTIRPSTTTTTPTTTIVPSTTTTSTTTTSTTTTSTTTTSTTTTTTTLPGPTTGMLLDNWTFEDLRTENWSGQRLAFSAFAHTGTRSLRSRRGSLTLQLDAYLTVGHQHQVVAYIADGAANLQVQVLVGSTRVPAVVDAPINGWRRVTVTFTPAQTTAATFNITSSSAVTVDDVDLYRF